MEFNCIIVSQVFPANGFESDSKNDKKGGLLGVLMKIGAFKENTDQLAAPH